MTSLVVGLDGNINEFEGCIIIAEYNNGNVDMRGFTDSPVIDMGVGNDDKMRLLE